MGRIKDFLFGRQIKIYDAKIGELTTRVKNENPSINYTWSGAHKLKEQARTTAFFLEGSSVGPYAEQLNSVYRIVDSLDYIILQVDAELKKQENINQRFKSDWIKEFYLAAVYSHNPDLKYGGKQFEINFEPIDESDAAYISLIWNNDKLSEIEAIHR